MRRNLFFGALLAALLAAPVAVGIVVLDWAWTEHQTASSMSGAMWSGRAFVAWFDLVVLVAWLPCARLVSRAMSRITAH